MFRNRNNSQKPDDDFISRFQQTFQEVVPRRDSDGEIHAGHFDAGSDDPMMADRPTMQSHGIKLEDSGMKFPNERTPRNLHDLNFSPSWMDPNSVNMMSIAPQHPGFYTPNSGGMGTISHNQAGDLHTPTLGLHSITPLSLSNPVAAPQQPHPQLGMEHFNPHYLAQQMPDMNPYMQPAAYAPSAFMQPDSGCDVMDESVDGSSTRGISIDHTSNISNMTSSTDFSTSNAVAPMGVSYAGENFRYNVSLRAPTAMVKHAREIPVSYLNKGQAYNLTILDSTPPITSAEPLRYRTFVRVSFEEEEQRTKPAICWQLWKEGRGTTEAHQRGGKLLAVEYVDPLQGEESKHRQIHIEQMSFDGFCVTWTANPASGLSECSIPVRFNFLSTDFSHSKGVKGIPVRLCAKTELLSPGEESGASRESEVCYCKVKLFRDHGAERKLSNDVAHVKKTIDKLKQQVSQAEMGGGFGKRKRGSTAATNAKSDRSKSKHKRSWSIGSQDGSDKLSLEDDLQVKLAMMQDMFSSTRSVSILALRGEEEDDPDLYPVRLPEGDSVNPDFLNRQNKSASQSLDSLILSPISSNASLHSPRIGSAQLMKEKHSAPIQRVETADRISQGFIEAVDIDPTYRPPAERPPKPTACFYVRFHGNEQNPQEYYYRAIYLTERTVRDLMKKISEKRHIDPSRIVRILHVNEAGLRIMVDDDVVRELPEGQDMIVDICESENAEVELPGSPVEIKLKF